MKFKYKGDPIEVVLPDGPITVADGDTVEATGDSAKRLAELPGFTKPKTSTRKK